jgi:hypothetical protein
VICTIRSPNTGGSFIEASRTPDVLGDKEYEILILSLYSMTGLSGMGFSLKTRRSTKLIMVRTPKNTKQPNHPKLGKIKLLATMPMLAAMAREKYIKEYIVLPNLYEVVSLKRKLL